MAGRRAPMRSGSSPRMRGTLLVFDQVHTNPRACGELFFFAFLRSRRVGSSPRMRGTRLGCNDQDSSASLCRIIPAHAGGTLVTRIIPAHAGNSPAWRAVEVEERIIPAHAGNSISDSTTSNWYRLFGSSPRHAGNSATTAARTRRNGVPDHPRACGELGPLRDYSSARGVTSDHPRACGELASAVSTR